MLGIHLGLLINMIKQIFEDIAKYNVIVLFRHVGADADALGSQFGLKTWIEEKYPSKKVYALGEDLGSKNTFYPNIDVVNDNVIVDALAIILDTANSDRIDDQRYKLAAKTIKIDHHMLVEQYADLEYITDLAGATCEILADLFYQNKEVLSMRCASYLYSGLIADTLRFSIPTTTPKTLQLAAYLCESNIDVAKINEQNFSTSLKLWKYENYLRSKALFLNDEIAYCIIRKLEYEQFAIEFSQAKEKVFVLGGVFELKAWAIFVEKELDEKNEPLFVGSLRSKNVMINDIAAKYHGGGHRFACGVKGLSKKDINKILNEIADRIHKEDLQ